MGRNRNRERHESVVGGGSLTANKCQGTSDPNEKESNLYLLCYKSSSEVDFGIDLGSTGR